MKQAGTRNIQFGKKPFMKPSLRNMSGIPQPKGAVPKGYASGSKIKSSAKSRQANG